MLDIHIYIAEFINAEDQFTYIHDALKTLNKMDFDKLIVAVPFALEQCLEILNDLLTWLPLNLGEPPAQSRLRNVFCRY